MEKSRKRPSRFDQGPPAADPAPVAVSSYPPNLRNPSQPQPPSSSSSQPDPQPVPPVSTDSSAQLSRLPIVGKRRMGGRVLKTGVLTGEKRVKTDDDTTGDARSGTSSSAKDPSSVYLDEIKKYSDHLCAEERHARPLVK